MVEMDIAAIEVVVAALILQGLGLAQVNQLLTQDDQAWRLQTLEQGIILEMQELLILRQCPKNIELSSTGCCVEIRRGMKGFPLLMVIWLLHRPVHPLHRHFLSQKPPRTEATR